MRNLSFVSVATAILVTACNRSGPSTPPAAPPAAAAEVTSAPRAGTANAGAPGRFVLFQGTTTSGPLVLRLDTASGKTWRLSEAPTYDWLPVDDVLFKYPWDTPKDPHDPLGIRPQPSK